MNNKAEELLYAELKGLPHPEYPFSDLASPHVDELAAEGNEWIDIDSPFQSKEALEKHKLHRLIDIAARGFPWLTLEELRPVACLCVFFAIIDDYLDYCSCNELNKVNERVTALLTGMDDKEQELGFYHQVYMIRQDVLTCKMPLHLYE
jgi:hypothetical protein